MSDVLDLMRKVRTSSTIPFMPPIAIDGKVYVDGGFGWRHCIGHRQGTRISKFFIVRTRTKEYRKNR